MGNIKTALFYSNGTVLKKSDLDEKINKWLENEKNIEVVDIKFSSSTGQPMLDNGKHEIFNIYHSALVVYRIK